MGSHVEFGLPRNALWDPKSQVRRKWCYTQALSFADSYGPTQVRPVPLRLQTGDTHRALGLLCKLMESLDAERNTRAQ